MKDCEFVWWLGYHEWGEWHVVYDGYEMRHCLRCFAGQARLLPIDWVPK